MNTEKIVGYILLGVGLISIIFSALSTYDVFTGKVKPPSVLKMESISVSPPPVEGTESSSIRIELISGEELSRLFNLAIWYMLMMFIVSAGAKIGSLGVQLSREIKVQVKGEG